MTYNKSRFEGFKPKNTIMLAKSLRKIKEVKIGEPPSRLPPAPEKREILDEEMAERERIAQLEIERKKLCSAPAYNKGAYQYVSSEEQAKDIGK